MSSPFPLLRILAPLRERTFDLLVIGGGIYGAWTAYDAALRGLSVALIEKYDWASGTSSASSKLIHGGLRYLEHYEFGLVRGALVERRRLHRLAPHLVRPLDFIVPVWKGPRANPFLLSAGLTVYDVLGGTRQPVDRHKRFSPKALLARYPFVDPGALLAGFRYGDCQEDDARMTLFVVAAAQAAGAVVASRVEAKALLREGGKAGGARVRESHDGEEFDIKARAVVVAAGPWTPGLLGAASPKVKLVKGIHIVLPAIASCGDAFLLTARDGRVFFVIPWYGATLVGTTEREVSGPEDLEATDDDVRYLLAGVMNGLPGIGWTEDDVIARYAGVRTLQAETAETLSAVTREFEIIEPSPGLVVPLGGKFTTSRGDAVEIVDRVQRALGAKRKPSLTARRPLPGTPESDEPFERWQAAVIPLLKRQGVDDVAARWLTLRHGSRVARVMELVREHPAWAARLHPGQPFIGAEAIVAVRDEMALSLDDVVRRRIPLRLLVRTDRALLKRWAELISPELRRDPMELLEEDVRRPGR
jgi:glycerol-3-phosphate dehydrogenase